MKTVNLLSAIFLFCTLFISCTKETINTDINKSLIPSSVDFQLNHVSYVLFTQDNGLLIAGVFNGKSTIIKTNFKFEVEWTKNNYEWGNIISGSGWGSSFYAPVIKKIFQKDDGTYVCLCSIEEGGDVVYSSTLLIELNKSGEQIRKVGFQDNVTTDVLQTNDGGCLLFGSKLIKLDQNYTQQWVKNIFGNTYYPTKIVSTIDGGFATTGTYNHDQVFLKKIDSNGNEISDYTYKHNDFPFNELGSDLMQLTDKGFLIIGRTRNINQLNDMDFQIIRTTFNGDTLWTKRFGNSSNDELDRIISFTENEFVLQGSIGYTNEDQKSILININADGLLLDSIRTEKFQMMLYSPLKFYIKVRSKDQDHITFTKIESENLFN